MRSYSTGGVISRRPAVPEAFGDDLRSDAVMAIDSEASSRRNWHGKQTVRLNGPLVPAHDTNQDWRVHFSPGLLREPGLKAPIH
jgi:hypothetical protein